MGTQGTVVCLTPNATALHSRAAWLRRGHRLWKWVTYLLHAQRVLGSDVRTQRMRRTRAETHHGRAPCELCLGLWNLSSVSWSRDANDSF